MARQCSAAPRSTMTSGDQQDGRHQLGQVAAGEDLADQPAQKAQAGDAQPDGQKADGDGAGDAAADALVKTRRRGSMCMRMTSKSNANIRHSTIRKIGCTILNMDANWDDLRVFLTLAREGTLTTAAKALGVSHPTVSRRVQALEQQIGARLFERLPDRFVPTSAGEELLADTEAMEKAALSIHRRSAGLERHGERRRAAVGRRGDGRPDRAPSAVAARAAAPHRVRGDREPHARQPVAARGRSPDPRAGAGARPASSRASSAASPMRSMPPRELRRCAAHRGSSTTCRGSASTTTTATCRASTGSSSGSTARGPRCAVNNWLVLHEAVGAGAGLAVLPCYLGDPDPALRRVGGVLPEVVAEQWLLVHRDLRALPRVRAVMDSLDQAVPGGARCARGPQRKGPRRVGAASST